MLSKTLASLLCNDVRLHYHGSLLDSDHARQATGKGGRERQEGDRVTTGRRQGGNRKATGKRQASNRQGTGERQLTMLGNREATGRRQGGESFEG